MKIPYLATFSFFPIFSTINKIPFIIDVRDGTDSEIYNSINNVVII